MQHFNRHCYVATPEAKPGDRIRIVIEGEAGYRPTSLDDGRKPFAEIEGKVAAYNARLGVTHDEAAKMVLRSMFS